MSRMIRIETCNDCYFKDIVGAFDRRDRYQPICKNGKALDASGRVRKLGFKMGSLLNGSPFPEYDGIIPDWCPLEKITQPEEK